LPSGRSGRGCIEVGRAATISSYRRKPVSSARIFHYSPAQGFIIFHWIPAVAGMTSGGICMTRLTLVLLLFFGMAPASASDEAPPPKDMVLLTVSGLITKT